ncbi:hypothetical protein FRC08_011972 [Ceratobasidium sp. 394]|nr:hypothetical protein FRC08_011972 [Ceratobasidium sp. 394]
MVALKLSLSSLAILLASTYAAPTELAALTNERPFLQTAPSGILSKGECPVSATITTCYTQQLSANSNENLDPALSGDGDVQTSFISTNTVDAAGGVTKYIFKFFLEPGLATPSSAGSVPLGSATKVWLDAQDDKVGIYAFSNIPVVLVPLSDFVGKMTVHTWTVKGGTSRYAHINIKDEATGQSILTYSVDQPNTLDSYRRVQNYASL